ncbi:cell wall hydrolase [Larsenimonas suaedae]|uniref:Cell wall hydrolase n=1 Tax=Larsenimonas suaedae TaxID=1851019 RepID=A0ABU1GW53_9GAMM|nr:cell wall hydrolase [Larsenimonas suaedae]MCM2973383.1 cell wall hydrolase [Larsenimonas suaedae]MDR5896276.1 cell wall hydrolase [Larsenimonas suaedae]
MIKAASALMALVMLIQTVPAWAVAQSALAEKALDKAKVLEQRAAHSRSAPVTLTKAGAAAIDPKGDAPLEDPVSCLARSVYWEAKGTDRKNMAGVASVVMNRLSDQAFPDTICGVVTQGSETGRCQFSWWCDGRPDQARELGEYIEAREIARQALNGELGDPTRGALYFHDKRVSPYWADLFTKTAETGSFEFYRPEK